MTGRAGMEANSTIQFDRVALWCDITYPPALRSPDTSMLSLVSLFLCNHILLRAAYITPSPDVARVNWLFRAWLRYTLPLSYCTPVRSTHFDVLGNYSHAPTHREFGTEKRVIRSSAGFIMTGIHICCEPSSLWSSFSAMWDTAYKYSKDIDSTYLRNPLKPASTPDKLCMVVY